MTFARSNSGLVLVLFVGAAVALSGCGGGGSGSGGSTQTAVINLITAQGVPTPLWQNINGSPTPPPVCPQGVFINSTITFTFSGAVDPLSLPTSGLALGSINVVDATTLQAAIGSFTVTDDPSGSVGNNRRVVFSPTPPGSPTATCQSGLLPASTYQVTIPSGGSSSQVLVVGSQPIQNSATTCFVTCNCGIAGPAPCLSSFTDPVPGPPFVVLTTPTTSNPSPPAVDPANIVGNTIQILVSEALNPAGIDLANVRIINSATGAQVPGSIVFHQAGSMAGLNINSRIDYQASAPLVGNVTYQVLFGPGVVDFGGNPIQPVQGNPTAQLFFQTIPVTLCPQAPIVETFDTVQFKDTVTGALRWAGDGVLQTEFPLTLTGTGADGPFTAGAGTTVIDTNQTVGGSSRMGIWNFTDVTIPTGSTVRIVGPYLAHLRCTGSFTLNGTIEVSAGTLAFTSVNVYDRGPEMGLNNNSIVTTVCTNGEANGGLSSAGGGQGGTGSGTTALTGMQCTIRALMGESGFGATIAGTLNTGTPGNIFYGGGQGGDSGCLPFSSPLTGCALGDLGGLGGAGGSAGRQGGNGFPRQNNTLCQPVTPAPLQPIAQATPIPPVMVPPIMQQSAGSGGGGGGDHLEISGVNADDQGGGGGGGGGGLRITCVGAFNMGAAGTPGTINAKGAQGQAGGQFAGSGGSGSGGEVWIQTFSTLTITSLSTINVDGPQRLQATTNGVGCSNFAAGDGGDGLVQLEAGQGPIPTSSFNLQPAPANPPSGPTGAVFAAPAFQFAGGVVGQATSLFHYVGYWNPTYTSAIEASVLGNAPNASLVIRYEGEFEAVNSTPTTPIADPSTLKTMATGGGPITAANISELNGYPFIRFVVNVSYATPPTTNQFAILPRVDQITINFNADLGCP